MDSSEDTTPLMSWYAKQYPIHACQQCNLEHNRIPAIISKNEIFFVPLEIIVTLHGTYTGPKPYDTPAHIHGLYLGIPGTSKPFLTGMISCN